MSRPAVFCLYNDSYSAIDPDMLKSALLKCAEKLTEGFEIRVHTSPMVPLDAPVYKHPGWLEWRIELDEGYEAGQGTLVALRRAPGAEIEFHS